MAGGSPAASGTAAARTPTSERRAQPATAHPFYYTVDKPRAVLFSDGQWNLCVSYRQEFGTKRRGNHKNKKASSTDKKFRKANLSRFYASKEEALAMAIEFCSHVEDVVRGTRPRRTVATTQTLTIQRANRDRAARVVGRSLLRRRAQRKLQALLVQERRRASWQKYRADSVEYLQMHIQQSNTVALLHEPPTTNMKVSEHVRARTQQKAMMVMVFLKYTMDRDSDKSHFDEGGTSALDFATAVGDLLHTNKTAVYNAYQEWKQGERVVESDDGPRRIGAFRNPAQGSYERRFLLDQEDLKMKFKKWMRTNLRKLSFSLAWEYLNSKLLKEVDDETLSQHNISLPISRFTAGQWMKKCHARLMGTGKCYYNDQHQKVEVITHREEYIKTINLLQKRMRVWVVLSKADEDRYLGVRQMSSCPEAMPVGKGVVIDDVKKYVHHMDDQGCWADKPVLHPLFKPSTFPKEDKWVCEFGHSHATCRCHLELREYGQDESIYRSGDHPSKRWGVDNRSYSISKSQGISKMVSAFKDYSKRGLGILMSVEELALVNAARMGKFYNDEKPMLPLSESPGLRIIDPTKAGDGYWNYEKMATQTEDMMHALGVLEPEFQQLHQYDWSSGHKKGLEGGLLISNTNHTFGGKGGKELRDSELSEDSVGDDDVAATMYESISEGSASVWTLTKPGANGGGIVKEHDCRVRDGDTQSMSFAAAEKNPPPPFYSLDASWYDTPNLDKQGNHRKTKAGTLKHHSGYAGKAKGVKQILWERGLWKAGMKAQLDSDHKDYPELSAQDVLARCQDFREELGAMQSLIQSSGHIVLFTSKGHPEIAGAGIEYDWGVSKMFFRRNTNHIARDHEQHVRLALSKVSLHVAKNTARRARSYMRAYTNEYGGSHVLIEKFVQIQKCHRNIVDQETAYLEREIVGIEKHMREVKEEQLSLAEEATEGKEKELVKV